ncbi:unnamed protein product [Rhizoctonia solani]|uniref:Uncharacterized protein n=1 Tax=Rhizoctonia solani TaxID=456999 RepID=A0A8H3GK64_9AGAM|nr:unnamed protein product [Rhizoctonia solani]
MPTQPTDAMPNNPFKGPDEAFRLPLGPDPASGSIDVNFSEACSIISRLASTWNSRLGALLSKPDHSPFSVGPGTTICVLVQPAVFGIFHHLAFGALGCTMQYVSLSLSDEVMHAHLCESKCNVILHSGIDDRIKAIKEGFDGEVVRIPEEEHAQQLARGEKSGRAGLAPTWPEPRRPTPALILHSSGTTGAAELFRFSLFWYTIPLPTDDPKVISAAYFSTKADSSSRSPQKHPKLIFSPPFWQSYHSSLLIHLLTATPVTFGYFPDAANLPSNQLVSWAKALDVGSIICVPRFLREISIEEFEKQAEFLGGLHSISLVGGSVDRSMSALFEKYQLRITNLYSSSEFGGGLSAKAAPYTHLHPGPKGPPLVLPISEPDLDGSRQVQLWHALSTSP